VEAQGLCEFSRVSLLAEVRAGGTLNGEEGRLSTLISLACLAAFLHSPYAHFVFLAMPSVARMALAVSIPMKPSGPPIQFHGLRQLYLGDRQAVARMEPDCLKALMALYARFYPGAPVPRLDLSSGLDFG
jgi:hypothetical protein